MPPIAFHTGGKWEGEEHIPYTLSVTHLASAESPKSGLDAPPTLSCVGVNPAAFPAPSSDIARLSTPKILVGAVAPTILVEEEKDVFAAGNAAANLAAALPALQVEKNAGCTAKDAAARATVRVRVSSISLSLLFFCVFSSPKMKIVLLFEPFEVAFLTKKTTTSGPIPNDV